MIPGMKQASTKKKRRGPGRPPRVGDFTRITADLPTQLARRLKARAARTGVSLTSIVETVLQASLEGVGG
jgi:predicted HicB family RNase H-like nuclease